MQTFVKTHPNESTFSNYSFAIGALVVRIRATAIDEKKSQKKHHGTNWRNERS